MEWISTTIKKEDMKLVLEGKKKSIKRHSKKFWKRMLHKHIGKHNGDLGINILHGRKIYKFQVEEITIHDEPIPIDNKWYVGFYDIKLGERLDK